MARIFISYRRGESSPYARMLYDSLSQQFGEANVFYDHKAIEPGLDFVDVIRQQLNSCDVLIALIGRHWLDLQTAAGQRRIDEADDIVHEEIATALVRKIRLIPVLVQGAPMPKAEELPPTLAALSRRNAFDLTDAKWEYDKQRLVELLQKIIPPAQPVSAVPAGPTGEASPVEKLLKRALLCRTQADEMFAESESSARIAKLREAHELLQNANELDATNTEVLLEMARLLVELTPDDPTDEERLLRRIKRLLHDPVNDKERYQLAQATFLLATSAEPVDAAAVEEARDFFDQLRRKDWVRQCDEALRAARDSKVSPQDRTTSSAPSRSGAQPVQEPPPLPPQQPAPLTAATLAGRWHVDILAMVRNSMRLDLLPNGTMQGAQEMPFVGSVALQGTWGFDPYNRVLGLQFFAQFQSSQLGIFLRTSTADGYEGLGSDGIVYQFHRL